MMKKVLASVAVAASLFALSVPASAAILTNWYIDTDGAGGNAPVQVANYLDLNGKAFVENTFGSDSTFTFKESASYLTLAADSATILSPILTSTFNGTGTGVTGVSGGTLSFDAGGILNVFSNANEIGTFSLLTGNALLGASNSVLPNGFVSLIFEATAMDAGYFYDSAMNDLSLMSGAVLGFATTNAIPVEGGAVTNALIDQYNSFFSTSLEKPYYADQHDSLSIANNGQFQLSTVPEPSMLSLLGLALVGLGFTTRRKFKV